MFVDYVKISLHAGDGGDGCVSFLREKYVPNGGPNGGDGGRGGHIYLVADKNMTTLLDLRVRPHFTTKRGQHGMGKNCTGKDAEDLYIKVPLGTSVSSEDGELLADLITPDEVWLAAKGGCGGAGNQHYATANNKAPRKFKYGGDGEEKTLILELKVIADVGLVGFPNAGKSSLLASLTRATPKIASYPFTTIHPNLGVMEIGMDQRVTIADIPGLIEGAHRGQGLGDRFLRHIERTRMLVHLVAPLEEEDDPTDTAGLLYSYDLIMQELVQYSSTLASRPQIVCLSKTDILTPEEIEKGLAAFESHGIKAIAISSITGDGIEELSKKIYDTISQLPPVIPVVPQAQRQPLPEFPDEEPDEDD
ncbi:MAG: GTPase ObgE [Candidatus Sumerlaeales bacterium]|nr:GTPase ObgE [Candidatus Sumerlaeales bacterium]